VAGFPAVAYGGSAVDQTATLCCGAVFAAAVAWIIHIEHYISGSGQPFLFILIGLAVVFGLALCLGICSIMF
jgi:hypothetical protein